MAHPLDKQASRLFRRQHGAVAHAQVCHLGLTDRMIDRRLGWGVWDSPFEGVYRLAGAPWTWRQSLMVATLAGYPDAAISHAAGYALWGVEPFARRNTLPPPEIITPRWHREQHAGLRVHESKELLPEDYLVVDGIPVIGTARLAADLPYYATGKEIDLALDDSVRRRLTTYPNIAARFGVMQPRGRRGFRKLSGIVDARCQRRSAQGAPDSGLVTLVARELVRAGLPTPEFEIVVPVDGIAYRVDLGWPWLATPKGLNVNGSHHEMESRRIWDEARAERLIRAGWDMQDVWSSEWKHDRAGCIERIVAWYRAA